MKQNMGTTDRIIRAVVGVAAVGAYFSGMVAGTWAAVALIAGVVLLGTAAIGWCPPYALLGLNTGAQDKS